MPGPLTEPPDEWSTTTNYPPGSDEWSGQPRRVEPSAGKYAAGFNPGEKPAAPWFNFMFGGLTAWVKYLRGFVDSTTDEYAYPVVKTRTLVLSPAGAVKGTAPFGTSRVPGWRQRLQGTDQETAAEALYSGSELHWDLHKVLPTGAVLTQVDVMAAPGEALASENTRMHIYIWEATPNFSLPAQDNQVGFEHYAPDNVVSTALHVFSMTGISYTISGTKSCVLKVRARINPANNHLFTVPDVCHAVRLTFTDPGPRNY